MNRLMSVLGGIAIAAAVTLGICVNAEALEYEVGVSHNSYTELTPTLGYHVKAGDEVYLWGSYEEGSVRMLGQELADTSILGFGVGAKKNFGKFSVFIEGGYGWLEAEDRSVIRDEIVYTQLVATHAVGGRTIPAGDPQYVDTSHTLYELSSAPMGRVGVGYQLMDHLKMTTSYRYMSAKEHYELWDEEVKGNPRLGGWWEESRGRDLSAWELTFLLTF